MGSELQVLCLCAAWCRSCDAYRELLSSAKELKVCWVDVEDQADLLPDFEVTQFPTLVVAVGPSIVFAGAVMPHLQVLKGLLESARSWPALQDSGWTVDDVAGLIGAARGARER